MEPFPQNIGGMIGDSKNEKKTEKRLWDLSLKFVEGRQWLSYDKRVSQFITANLQADGQSRVTVNLLPCLVLPLHSRDASHSFC